MPHRHQICMAPREGGWPQAPVEGGHANSVIAQIWRGSARQAIAGRLIGAGRVRGGPVIIDELTAERAEQIGITIGATPHPDIADVHVALAAADRGHAVLTSDDADIAEVNPQLVIVHV